MDDFPLVRFKQAVNNRLERFPPGNSLIDQVEKGKTQQISHVLKILARQQKRSRGRCEDARICLLIVTRDDPVNSRISEEESIDRKGGKSAAAIKLRHGGAGRGAAVSLRNDAVAQLPPGFRHGVPS